jgi:hypothetical protein
MKMLSKTFSERAGLSAEIVKVAVAPFQPQKLVGDDARKSGSNQGTFGFFLRYGSNEQINIVDRVVQQLEFLNHLLNNQLQSYLQN